MTVQETKLLIGAKPITNIANNGLRLSCVILMILLTKSFLELYHPYKINFIIQPSQLKEIRTNAWVTEIHRSLEDSQSCDFSPTEDEVEDDSENSKNQSSLVARRRIKRGMDLTEFRVFVRQVEDKVFERIVQEIAKNSGTPGPPGAHGNAGLQGPQGPQGVKGDRGDSGSNGQPGNNGATGGAGNNGPPGFPGVLGPQGVLGTKGESGNKGYHGEEGKNGIPGMHGPKGDSGSAGMPGHRGVKGEMGALGMIGPPGLLGEMGKMGEKGDRGPQGSPGPPGAPGIPAVPALQGPTGPPGSQGNSGPTGSPGAQGIKGKIGDQGLLGAPGPRGEAGLGSMGAPGVKGDGGSPGVDGSPGTKGEFGSRGLPGSTGLKGNTGSRGIPGEKGERGFQSLPGVQGPPGVPGLPSPPGPPGPSGQRQIKISDFASKLKVSKYGNQEYPGLPPRTVECVITMISSPTSYGVIKEPYGALMVDSDPASDGDAQKVWITIENNQTLFEYNDQLTAAKNLPSKTYELYADFQGNAHVVYNGAFFYQAVRSKPRIIKYYLNTETNKILDIPLLMAKNAKKLYRGGHNYLDFSVDENGLWVIFAVPDVNNTAVLKVDADTMTIQNIWNITLDHHIFDEMFVASGILYAINSVTTPDPKISLAFDLYAKKPVQVEWNNELEFGKLSMVTYDFRTKQLLTWESKQDQRFQMGYPVVCEERNLNHQNVPAE